jgi:uncharacterized membrane protein YbhN (UPF0104 family)
MWIKRGVGLLSVLVSAGLIWWLIARLDLEQAAQLLRHAQWRWLIFALAITCCLPLTSAIRWLGVLRAQKHAPLPLPVAVRAIMMANVLNSFMPSKAGDIAKAIYLRHHGGLSRGVGSVILERMVDLAVLGVLGILGYFESGVIWGLWVGLALLSLIAAALVFVLWAPLHRLPLPGKIMEKADALRSVFHNWVRHPAAMLQTLAGSVATWVISGLTICALVAALGEPISWGLSFSTFPPAILAGLVPLTISGVGTRDSVLVFLLGAHMPREAATLVGIGYTFYAYWLLSLISFPAVAVEVIGFLKGKESASVSASAPAGR